MNTELIRQALTDEDRTRFETYMAEIFGRLGMDLSSEACQTTPQRFVKALVDMTEGYNGDDKIKVFFTRECVNCAEDVPTVQIVEGPIHFTSLCEHHVLPFVGTAYVGYLRHKHIIGLSKFARIVRKYAHRFSVQERIAQEIAHELEDILKPHGVIVYLQAHHACTQCRGVREMDAFTRSLERRGAYVSAPHLVAEFMSMIHTQT